MREGEMPCFIWAHIGIYSSNCILNEKSGWLIIAVTVLSVQYVHSAMTVSESSRSVSTQHHDSKAGDKFSTGVKRCSLTKQGITHYMRIMGGLESNATSFTLSLSTNAMTD